MKQSHHLLTMALMLLLAACTAGPEQHSVDSRLDPDDPSILRRPFTAEQIRAEWRPGFSVDMRRSTPEGTVLERWTVVAADEDGVDIEFVALDESGRPSGEQRIQRSDWVELRNHASFPAARSTLEEVTRETALGTLDGWLYRVREEDAGSVTEYFFARSLPGAPVWMRAERSGELVMELQQVARRRPDRPM
jgi:hypothetical protein